MKVLVIGAAGMIGHRLAQHLLNEGVLGGVPLAALTAFDVVPSDLHHDSRVTPDIRTGDISDAPTVAALIAARPDVIFHLAAVVSGEAEADFDKGYRINLDGTRHLFEAIRAQPDYCPRVVYSSSIVIFGAPFNGPISDTFMAAPLTSYGTQKMIGELLLNDYSRRGILDGIGIRLPTIVVRPGKPNKAASGFFSGIIREPLAGLDAILPVDDDVKHWLASPGAALGFLLHAAAIDLAPLGARRCLTMPGVAVTVGEMQAALAEIAGPEILTHIKREPDPVIRNIIDGWPREFDPQRALALGFTADASIHDIIRAHMRDMGQGRE